ncbi:MAG TPA: NDP-sugar synthase [Acidimicrobiales bacterium]|nr:NDP-sugar synthase [Acidimicrobiales bacterium]
MKAVVLVGGEGTRLRPLTLSIPKQMLPIVEQAMLERVLGQLARYGVDEAVLSLGYLPDAFMKAYPDGMAAGVRLSYAVEPEPLDTAGAIRFAALQLGVEETFVVVNGDVLTDMDLGALLAFHRAQGAEGTISLHPVDDPSAFGVVPTDESGRVRAFVEKPRPGEAPTNLINAGTYVLEPSTLDRIPGGRRVSIERETFPAMVTDGRLFALADAAYWLDTGTPASYLGAHWDLLEGRRPGPPAPGARTAGTGVWVLGVPDVEAGGEVRGPALLGDGALVRAGAVVDRAVVGHDCIVGPGARIERSVLLPGAVVDVGATVTGSIVGPGAQVGARSEVRPVSVLGVGAVVDAGAVLTGERVPP